MATKKRRGNLLSTLAMRIFVACLFGLYALPALLIYSLCFRANKPRIHILNPPEIPQDRTPETRWPNDLIWEFGAAQFLCSCSEYGCDLLKELAAPCPLLLPLKKDHPPPHMKGHAQSCFLQFLKTERSSKPK